MKKRVVLDRVNCDSKALRFQLKALSCREFEWVDSVLARMRATLKLET